jgi:hypothetical protein
MKTENSKSIVSNHCLLEIEVSIELLSVIKALFELVERLDDEQKISNETARDILLFTFFTVKANRKSIGTPSYFFRIA